MVIGDSTSNAVVVATRSRVNGTLENVSVCHCFVAVANNCAIDQYGIVCIICQGSGDQSIDEQKVSREIVSGQQQQPLTIAIVIPC